MNSRFFRTMQSGFKSLVLHKLRAGLATLGILIGVTAVIWLVALGEGVSYQAQQQIKELGATNVIVRSVKPPASGRTGMSTSVLDYGLTRDDFDRIAAIPTVKRAVPLREIRKEVRYLTHVVDARFIGCTPDYMEMNHLRMMRGRFLSDTDLKRIDNVCVIGDQIAQQLFPFENPIGKSILVEDTFYVVIGQTENRMPSASIGGSLEGRDYNNDIYIPLTTLKARIGDLVITARSGSREGEVVELSQITVTVDDVNQVEEAAAIIGILLEKYHKNADYSITVPKELLRQAEMLRLMFNVLLILIAGISLVVGGIGIMNIMLATVTERTREIGIRRAMGAKRRDIIQQFLAETIVLTGTGGVLGIAFGTLCRPGVWLVHWGLQRFPDVWKSLPPTIQQLDPRIAPWSIVAAAGISVGVGILFGLYPAQRAAAMDPIEALRHE